MSDTNIMNFLAALARDETLARRFASSLDGKEGEIAIRAATDFITAEGHPVSADEVAAFRAAMLDALDRDGDLSEAALDEVSGGIDPITVGAVAALLVPVGVMATVGAVGALVHKGPVSEKLKVFFSAW